ncbi:hypothetical protein T07_6920 [Trichinella nelsoni]|uniref:Uncharacterized protein n=1 Tax=Trichinella nelsoni TaxID=6336 RepID=A0A0V0SEG4_9BILA|nr:hypothetical protein T07_6920 [Trichinella nelsoni]
MKKIFESCWKHFEQTQLYRSSPQITNESLNNSSRPHSRGRSRLVARLWWIRGGVHYKPPGLELSVLGLFLHFVL